MRPKEDSEPSNPPINPVSPKRSWEAGFPIGERLPQELDATPLSVELLHTASDHLQVSPQPAKHPRRERGSLGYVYKKRAADPSWKEVLGLTRWRKVQYLSPHSL